MFHRLTQHGPFMYPGSAKFKRGETKSVLNYWKHCLTNIKDWWFTNVIASIIWYVTNIKFCIYFLLWYLCYILCTACAHVINILKMFINESYAKELIKWMNYDAWMYECFKNVLVAWLCAVNQWYWIKKQGQTSMYELWWFGHIMMCNGIEAKSNGNHQCIVEAYPLEYPIVYLVLSGLIWDFTSGHGNRIEIFAISNPNIGCKCALATQKVHRNFFYHM